MENNQSLPGRTLALIGGLWGVIGAVILMTIRAVLGADNGAPLPESLPGHLVFGLVYLLPFGLTLAALRGATPTQRAAAWLSAGVLAILLSFTAFSGVSLVFLPAAPFLILAGLRALPGIEPRRMPIAIGLALVLVALNVGAFRVLFLTEDGQCWERVRSEDGSETWQSVPYATSGTASAIGSGSGVVGTTCTSDVISAVEMLASLALVGLAAGAWIIARRVSPVSPQLAEPAL